MVLPSEQAARLEESEFFRSISPARLRQLQPYVRERHYRRHQILFQEGQPAEFLWVLHSGQVRILKTAGDGSVTTLETIRPGELFGAVAALEQRGYPATAEASCDSAVWRLSRVNLLGVLRDEPLLTREILRIVAQRLRGAHDRLRSFAHDHSDARLARALLAASVDGEARVTRRELAEAAGSTVETAIRVLRRFERAGLIHGAVSLIRIADREALERLAVGGGRPPA